MLTRRRLLTLLAVAALLVAPASAGDTDDLLEMNANAASGSGEEAANDAEGAAFDEAALNDESSGEGSGSGEEMSLAQALKNDTEANRKSEQHVLEPFAYPEPIRRRSHANCLTRPLAVFTPNVTVDWRPPRLSLEEFVSEDLSDVHQALQLSTATLRLRLFKFLDTPEDELGGAYEDALDELYNVAPNLERVHATGGHLTFAANATMENIDGELRFVVAALRALARQLHVRNMTLVDENDYIKYNLYQLIDEQSFNKTAYTTLLSQTFGRKALLPSIDGSWRNMVVLYDAYEISIMLDLLIYTDMAGAERAGLRVGGERVDASDADRALAGLH